MSTSKHTKNVKISMPIRDAYFFRNKKALLMTLSFSLFNGLIASWYSVMDITFAPLLEESGDTSDVDGLIGYIGLIAIIANSVTTILVSAIVDR